ncbi:MAG: CvpA family protein [Rhodocyclales bacterium]|nr:CvpA family protein [Rhodocyclales bacterium]
MTVFDFAVFGIVGASVLVGLWRGVASEMLALAAWVAAFFTARHYGHAAGGLFAGQIADPTMSLAAGFVAVFVAVLIVFALARFVVSRLLRAVGLGLLDRLLGGIFGIARGMLIVLAAVLVGGMTSLPKASGWRESVLAPPLETAVIAGKAWLPPELAKRIRY